MTRWENYLLSAEKIIDLYKGELPLHHFLKTFFKQHPQMGSRDRRWISQLVYHYFRLGHWQLQMDVKTRMLMGAFLCETKPNELLANLKPEWNAQVQLPLMEKLQAADATSLTPAALFSFIDELSPDIDANTFAYTFLQQPGLFIRIRNNKLSKVLPLLDQAAVSYEVADNKTTVALPNGTKIETLLPEKSWYEIQDASSQQTGLLLHPRKNESWWDCCAASGGKSILLKDQRPDVQLLVTDVRRSILDNLQQRFAAAGIKQYESRVADLAADNFPATMGKREFDGIILDAPCSGSGTWGRTPESLRFFQKEEILKYQQLQKRIAHNVIPFLKKGGSLIYITCSVFRQENEEVINYIEEISGLRKQEGGIIAGYGKGADTMFAVRLA
ncbi:MAG TPA: RsmB/NOP family class I SAM-dependent RNA methyltransferase [Chitinophaga sp.]|uniref:RsmB/NOP family class I SAM-dependent RNA methyltransferase n=1 Tax=Chitinophaga sp. TaxID=1869181 RepID=UPI002CD50F8A|nr:RsmB/NOP family class I SAM-dependent RNA methyltransferase [Chitinophaga sp.]HVI43268.1 RsmB/NOP family class I SAM-dependent RNA methyltransferase [Chitinophaga sp.]